jgi:hypothetical protein
MAVLVTAIYVYLCQSQVMDGRNKSGHDIMNGTIAWTSRCNT